MSYVIDIRRELHQYPELGFDLPYTLNLVRRELESMKIPYTEKYGRSCIVATLNDNKTDFTIGLRADMDALPINEKTKVPYKSKSKGKMHACGHDVHTAILLDTARKLMQIKDKISCRVKFIFQSAEEGPESGAKLMVEDGVMDDIDCILALHCDSTCKSGQVMLTPGPQNAVSRGFYIEFYGKSSHAANQENGIDAITMAVKAYTALHIMMSKEISAKDSCVLNVGTFHGGSTNNVVCDYATMFCTLRTWNEENDADIIKRVKRICSSIAKESGGKSKVIQAKYYPIVYNNGDLTKKLIYSISNVIGKDNIIKNRRTFGGEDFSYYAQKKPGCMFRLGIRNEEKDCIYPLHNDKFNVDEGALQIGSDIFVRFVVDNMK